MVLLVPETEMEALRPAEVEEEVVRDPPVVVPVVPVVITEVLDPALEVPAPVLVVATMVMVTIIGKIINLQSSFNLRRPQNLTESPSFLALLSKSLDILRRQQNLKKSVTK